MKSKKALATLTCAALLAMPAGAFAAESTDVSLRVGHAYIGGSPETGDVYINDSGRAMVPLRLVSEAMDYDTVWQPDGSVRITSADGTVDVSLTIGSTAYTANGTAGTFETAPTLKNDRTYLPVRDFSELYGNVYWDNDSRTVWVTQGDSTEYAMFGANLLRSDANGVQQLVLPEGVEEIIESGPDLDHTSGRITNIKTIDGITYLAVNVYGSFRPNGTVWLFRDDGTEATFLTNVYGGGQFTVNGSNVYYTEALGAGAWQPAQHPNRLYWTDLDGNDTASQVYYTTDLDFDISKCGDISVTNGVLIATDMDGTTHTVNLDNCDWTENGVSQG